MICARNPTAHKSNALLTEQTWQRAVVTTCMASSSITTMIHQLIHSLLPVGLIAQFRKCQAIYNIILKAVGLNLAEHISPKKEMTVVYNLS